MSNVQTSAEREIVDLSHLAFDCGMIGRLKTVSWTPVIAVYSVLDAVGSLPSVV